IWAYAGMPQMHNRGATRVGRASGSSSHPAYPKIIPVATPFATAPIGADPRRRHEAMRDKKDTGRTVIFLTQGIFAAAAQVFCDLPASPANSWLIAKNTGP